MTDRDRSIAVIAALGSQNVTDEHLATYLSVARQNGVDEEGLTTLMVLLTAYIGQPFTSLRARLRTPQAVARDRHRYDKYALTFSVASSSPRHSNTEVDTRAARARPTR